MHRNNHRVFVVTIIAYSLNYKLWSNHISPNKMHNITCRSHKQPQARQPQARQHPTLSLTMYFAPSSVVAVASWRTKPQKGQDQNRQLQQHSDPDKTDLVREQAS